MKRRDFLRIMGAITGSTFLSSCGKKESSRKLVSYIMPPSDGTIPGIPYYYPSACGECPAGCGMTVKVREGWPIKLEGAKGHPVNEGGLCIRGQASLSRLYHPDRIKTPLVKEKRGKFSPVSWEKALETLKREMKHSREMALTNLYLSSRQTGTLSRLSAEFCEASGCQRLPFYEPYPHAAIREANRILHGIPELPRYRLEGTDFLLTIGADILETFVSPVSFAKQVSRERARAGFSWYHVEPHVSLTGMNADKRIVIEPMREAYLLTYLLASFSDGGRRKSSQLKNILSILPSLDTGLVSKKTGISKEVLRNMRDALLRSKRPLLIAGGVSTGQVLGIEVALLAGLVNWETEALGRQVDLGRGENYSSIGSLRDMDALSLSLSREKIGTLILSRTDPVSTLPPRMAFRENLGKAAFKVGFTDLMNETCEAMDLIFPLSHPLESWDDQEPRVGLVNLVKPVITPLHGTLGEGDILLRLMETASGKGEVDYKNYLYGEWKRRFGEKGTKELLSRGWIEYGGERGKASLDVEGARNFLKDISLEGKGEGPYLLMLPSIRTFDGRSEALPLLSEIPDPMTTISYGRWLSISKEKGKAKRIREKEIVSISTSGWSARVPVKFQEGLSRNVHMVYRDMLKDIPFGVEERSGEPLAFLGGLTVKGSGRKAKLPILSGSFSQSGRGIIPEPVHHEKEYRHHKDSIYPEHHHDVYRWSMAIDLDLCTGCSACVASCYIENNIPVVGRREHLKGREMSWLRIEPYFDGESGVEFVPMLCQQCHYAPCESVCPVYATYHNPEGLNVQVFNRCVGTRYCANNCPYKARRFNWFTYKRRKPLDKMVNPDILVRSHGVMEKCTFCIQRIRVAKDHAKDEKRKVGEGEVTTACAQSCPSDAITFGNLLDKNSRVYRLAKSERAYRVYEGLGTEPSVYYLKKRKYGNES